MNLCNPWADGHGLKGEGIVAGLEQYRKVKLRHETFHLWNPCGKSVNDLFPNVSPHRKDAIRLRLLPLCHRLVKDREQEKGVVFSRHIGHKAGEKHPNWEGMYGRFLSPRKS